MLARLAHDAGEAHVMVARLALTVPLLLILPALAEAVQHCAEWSLGMFEPGGMATAANHPLRMVFGAIKVVTILTAAVFAARYWASGNDWSAAARLSDRARAGLRRALLFIVVVLLVVMLAPIAVRTAAAAGWPVPARLSSVAPLLVLLATLSFTQGKSLGILSAVIGGQAESVDHELIARGRPLWFVTLLMIAVGPAMFVHYMLNYGAVDRDGPLTLALLTLDALVVGAMALLIGALTWLGYRDGPTFAAQSAMPPSAY